MHFRCSNWSALLQLELLRGPSSPKFFTNLRRKRQLTTDRVLVQLKSRIVQLSEAVQILFVRKIVRI